MSPNDAGVSDTLISKVLLCFGALTKRARFVFGAATEEIVPEKGTIIRHGTIIRLLLVQYRKTANFC